MNREQKDVTEKKASVTVRYGRTLYKVIFRFAEKGKPSPPDPAGPSLANCPFFRGFLAFFPFQW